jgi:hypothetical protein
MNKFLFWLISFTWALIQNIIGLIIFLFCKFVLKFPTITFNNAKVVEWSNQYGSVSLGSFMFVSNMNDPELLAHERGHTTQGMILGPLFLLLIGLPSIIWAACFADYRKRKGKTYYEFYTESWANKIAGLDKYGHFIN